MTVAASSDVSIVCAADAQYFPLLKDLVDSIAIDPVASRFALSVLDLGLTDAHRAWLQVQGATVKAPGWDMDFPGRERIPAFFQAMTARPFLPKHFPGYAVYLWIDADAWVQDGTVLDWYVRAARRGLLAITPEVDRAYSSFYKRPKLFGWGQNFKAYRFAFGWRIADRLARYPILNSGVFALAAEAPHWALWAQRLNEALNRRRLRRLDIRGLELKLVEQTALNRVVHGDKASATFLPAVANWFCGKGAPMYDAVAGRLVEPNEPHAPLGVVHLAGHRIQEKVFNLKSLAGSEATSKLTFSAIRALGAMEPAHDG